MTDESDLTVRLSRLVAGVDEFERPVGFEPNLLPALAERCGPEVVGVMASAAEVFGSDRSVPYAWPHLRESTMLTLLRRFGRDDLLGWTRGETGPAEVDVWRVMLGDELDVTALRARIEAEDDWRGPQLIARLVASGGDLHEINTFCERQPGRDLDACAVRALADAADQTGEPLRADWLAAAIGSDADWLSLGRAAHLLPALPAASRPALTTRIIAGLAPQPFWFAALVASALGDDAPVAAVDELRTDEPFPPIWQALIDDRFARPRPRSADEVVARSHPFLTDLPDAESVPGDLIVEMLDRWGGTPAMAAPDEDPGTGAPAHPAITTGEQAIVPTTSSPIGVPPGAPSGAPRGAPAGEPAAEPVDDRRLGIEVAANGSKVERAMIRDSLTEITVSIAPPGAVEHQLATPANVPFPSAERLRLPVTLFDSAGAQTEHLEIWPSPTSQARVTFDVVPSGEHFHATIVIYQENGSTVIQAASLGAQVVADAAAEAAAEPSMRLVEVSAAAIGTAVGDRVGSVVADVDQAVVSAPGVPIRALPTGAVQGVAPLLAQFRTTASNFVHTGGAADITPALIAAGQLGFRLRRTLQLDPLADLDRIQVVPLFPAAVFPLELVYDGEPPADDAMLCTAWTAAPPGGSCPTCDDLSDTTTICPLRFWGLTKVIEHHCVARAESGAGDMSAPFVAREHVRSNTQLPPTEQALMAASVEVANALGVAPATGDIEAHREALTTTFAAVVEAVEAFGTCAVARDWSEWEAAISEREPGLLIAMPHQAGDSLTVASLELGGVTETTLLERHVRPSGDSPGPVVLLLGCDTSNAPNMLASFASDMRWYAPVVVATIGRVVAAEAPHVAAVIVKHLHVAGGIGSAIVAARRELLAESRLVGLQLIAHGDARWEVVASDH